MRFQTPVRELCHADLTSDERREMNQAQDHREYFHDLTQEEIDHLDLEWEIWASAQELRSQWDIGGEA